jgi:Helicase associated domain
MNRFLSVPSICLYIPQMLLLQTLLWLAPIHGFVSVSFHSFPQGIHSLKCQRGWKDLLYLKGGTEPNPEHAVTTGVVGSENLPMESSTPYAYSPSPILSDPESPVLRSLLPHLVHHQTLYGNPNIPLGSSSGRQCATLRRLRIQNKLSESDLQFMETHFSTFLWHSLEDVYEQHEFEPLFQRLLLYGGDYSPPKKYPDDPELGAWVTALRRLYKIQRVDPLHIERLDAIGFSWTTPRQCGSKFMIMYRMVMEQYAIPLATTPTKPIDKTTLQWIEAHQAAFETLSQTRQQYMRELLGREDWQNWQPLQFL